MPLLTLQFQLDPVKVTYLSLMPAQHADQIQHSIALELAVLKLKVGQLLGELRMHNEKISRRQLMTQGMKPMNKCSNGYF